MIYNVKNKCLQLLIFALLFYASTSEAAKGKLGSNLPGVASDCSLSVSGAVFHRKSPNLRTLLFASLVSQFVLSQEVVTPHYSRPESLTFGAVISAPLASIHPSQVSTGHQKIYRGYEKELASGFTDLRAQEELLSRELPAVVGPSGTLYLQDGHHGVSQLRVREAAKGLSGQFTAKLHITGNYLNSSWAEFGESMLREKQMYFTSESLQILKQTLKTSQSVSEADRIWYGFFMENLPSDFLDLPDNPWRALVSEVLHKMNIEKHQCFRNFFEFHLAEALPAVLTRMFGDLSSSLEACPSFVKGFSCSSLSSIKKKAVRAFHDPLVQRLIDDDLKDEKYKDEAGKDQNCKAILRRIILKS